MKLTKTERLVRVLENVLPMMADMHADSLTVFTDEKSNVHVTAHSKEDGESRKMDIFFFKTREVMRYAFADGEVTQNEVVTFEDYDKEGENNV